MRINVSKGSDPLRLSQYILDSEKQSDADRKACRSPILATNMFGKSPEELAEEFRFSHELNPRVKVTMCHYSVSLAPGESVSDEEKIKISKAMLEKMGHKNCQWFVTSHHDREHRNGVEHWHVATSSVDLEGQWVPDHFNYVELKQVERDLERNFGLQYCPAQEKKDRLNLTTGEYRLKERTGQTLPKEKLRAAIDKAVEDRPSMPLLMARVKALEMTIQFHEFENGKGFSFGTDGKYFRGRDLGHRYSFEKLQEHLGVDYNPERDDAMLRELNLLTPEQCQAILNHQPKQLEQTFGLAELFELPDPQQPEIQQQSPVFQDERSIQKQSAPESDRSQKTLKPTTGQSPTQNFGREEHVRYGEKNVEYAANLGSQELEEERIIKQELDQIECQIEEAQGKLHSRERDQDIDLEL